jgi:hypothetical protein
MTQRGDFGKQRNKQHCIEQSKFVCCFVVADILPIGSFDTHLEHAILTICCRTGRLTRCSFLYNGSDSDFFIRATGPRPWTEYFERYEELVPCAESAGQDHHGEGVYTSFNLFHSTFPNPQPRHCTDLIQYHSLKFAYCDGKSHLATTDTTVTRQPSTY